MKSWLPVLGAIIVLTIAAYARWTPPSRAGDLRPRPDALEYESGARNMLHGTGYYLVVEGRRYPPRYPPGFSVLLVPFLFAWDGGPGSGIIAVLATALIGTALAIVTGHLVAGPLAGLVAGMLLAASPAHVRLSRMVMSDVPSACVVASVGLVLAAAVRRPPIRAWALAVTGLLIGCATTIHATNALLVIPAAVVVATLGGGPGRAAVIASATLVGVAPLLLYDASRFGSPFATGYGRWATISFATSFATAPPVGGGTEPNLSFYGRTLAGLGDLYPWPWAVLIALGAVCALRSKRRDERAVVMLGALFLALLCGVYVTFFWQASRFLIPALPLLVALAGLPFASHRARTTRMAAASLVLAGLLVLARSPALYRQDMFLGEADMLREVASKTEPGAVLVIRTNEHFFSLLLRANGADRVWVPLDLDEHMLAVRWFKPPPVDPSTPVPAWIDESFAGPYAADRADAAMHALLATGRPVYVSGLLGNQVPWFRAFLQMLNLRFTTTRVATVSGVELYRVGELGGHSPRL